MTARYLLKITDESAQRLEKWLAGRILIVPARPEGHDPLADLRLHDIPGAPELEGVIPDGNRAEAERRLARIEPVVIAGLDAITDEEYEVIERRLRSSGPLYHAGGPS
jgi:hypothetical protein